MVYKPYSDTRCTAGIATYSTHGIAQPCHSANVPIIKQKRCFVLHNSAWHHFILYILSYKQLFYYLCIVYILFYKTL